MNINDFVAVNSAKNYLGLNAGTQPVSRASSAGQTGLDKAEKRIQTQVDVTSAQLSAFGQLKSNVSTTQISAKALGELTPVSTSAAVKTAAQNFVGAFNTSVSAAKSTAATVSDGNTARSASQTGRDLVRSVSTDSSTRDALKKIGFTLQSDGQLALDTKVFAAAQTADPSAVNAALAKLGQQVNTTTTQQLAGSGGVTGTVSSLNQRAAVLKNQQSTLASLQQNTNAAASALSSGYGGFGSQGSIGVAAYQNY